MKIGKFVQNCFIPYLKKICSTQARTLRVIHHLKKWNLVGECPVIKEMSEIKEDEERRYYVTPVRLNGTDYRVCNHWFAKDEEPLKVWMSNKVWEEDKPYEQKQ